MWHHLQMVIHTLKSGLNALLNLALEKSLISAYFPLIIIGNWVAECHPGLLFKLRLLAKTDHEYKSICNYTCRVQPYKCSHVCHNDA